MGFNVMKLNANAWCPQGIWQLWVSFALFKRKTYLGKRSGLLFTSKHHQAGVFSLRGIYFASRKLQASCFVSFVWLLWNANQPSITIYCFPCVWQEYLYLPTQGYLERRICLEWVSRYLSPLQTTSAHRDFWRWVDPLALLQERAPR